MKMSFFSLPKWDVNNAGATLNKQLFGPSLKNKKSPTNGSKHGKGKTHKSTSHFTSNEEKNVQQVAPPSAKKLLRRQNQKKKKTLARSNETNAESKPSSLSMFVNPTKRISNLLTTKMKKKKKKNLVQINKTSNNVLPKKVRFLLTKNSDIESQSEMCTLPSQKKKKVKLSVDNFNWFGSKSQTSDPSSSKKKRNEQNKKTQMNNSLIISNVPAKKIRAVSTGTSTVESSHSNTGVISQNKTNRKSLLNNVNVIQNETGMSVFSLNKKKKKKKKVVKEISNINKSDSSTKEVKSLSRKIIGIETLSVKNSLPFQKKRKYALPVENSGVTKPEMSVKRRKLSENGNFPDNVLSSSKSVQGKTKKQHQETRASNAFQLTIDKLKKKHKKKKKKSTVNSNGTCSDEISLPTNQDNKQLLDNSGSDTFVSKLKHFIANRQSSKTPIQDEHQQTNKNRWQTDSLRERMMKRLLASRFRYLNEQMYNSDSKEAQEYFQRDPDAFLSYHKGYQQQVTQWPLNPLDKIISSIQKKSENLVVADFGCGDARLSWSVPNVVHSFDLVALTDDVTACDMAHTPLDDASVDIAVFCLSLMGTNLSNYLIEANRVLKQGGILKIAEVESRFEKVETFIQNVQKYGFTNIHKDLSHNLFYFMDFKKEIDVKKSKKLPYLTLKPCLYKKR